MPLRVTICGDPVALSVMVRVPVREPGAVGSKVMETVHVPEAAMDPEQVLVSSKSPEGVMEVRVMGADWCW